MKSKTLVILTPGFPADEGDTACLPAQQVFVRTLNKVFPELKVVVLALEYPHYAGKYTWFGNTVISYNGWKRGRIQKLLTFAAVWFRLRKLSEEGEVVGLLSWWCGPCALVGKYFSRMKGLRHFAWILGQDAREGNQWVRWIRPGADELVAMSRFLSEEFSRNYRVRPAFVVPNGVDTGLFGPMAVERDLDILGVGNLTELKRYDLFVRVVAGLPAGLGERFSGVRGGIVGKGPERDRLQGMIDEAGLGERLKLLGEMPHVEALGYMQRTKVFLHTSSYEGFSTVCLEALYAGAHVISFCDPMGVKIEHWHVVGSEEEMLEKALALLSDPATDYTPVRLYTMEESVRAMMGLYGYKPEAIS
ncbi:MAG: glycosyltransferase [Bacteroidetes bacterium]|nr:glycosyltransferase [Bacteroidota bacterium]